MQSASDTFSEAFIISNWCKHHVGRREGGGGEEREVDRPCKTTFRGTYASTSIEYCEAYKIPRRVGFLWVPRSLVPRSSVFIYPSEG